MLEIDAIYFLSNIADYTYEHGEMMSDSKDQPADMKRTLDFQRVKAVSDCVPRLKHTSMWTMMLNLSFYFMFLLANSVVVPCRVSRTLWPEDATPFKVCLFFFVPW